MVMTVLTSGKETLSCTFSQVPFSGHKKGEAVQCSDGAEGEIGPKSADSWDSTHHFSSVLPDRLLSSPIQAANTGIT